MFLRSAILICVIWPAVCSAASADDSDVLTAVVADICGGDLSSKYLIPDTAVDADYPSRVLEGADISPEISQSQRAQQTEPPISSRR
jgi:hypothetical protein